MKFTCQKLEPDVEQDPEVNREEEEHRYLNILYVIYERIRKHIEGKKKNRQKNVFTVFSGG